MYEIVRLKSFNKSLKKLQRSGALSKKTVEKLRIVVAILAEGKQLASSFKDHQLNGKLRKYRECHIKGDLLLVYRVDNDVLALILVEVGSHSQIFG